MMQTIVTVLVVLSLSLLWGWATLPVGARKRLPSRWSFALGFVFWMFGSAVAYCLSDRPVSASHPALRQRSGAGVRAA